MRLITIINLLSLLFTPIQPNTIKASGVGGSNTIVEPIYYTNRADGSQVLSLTSRENGTTGDGAQPCWFSYSTDDYIYLVSSYYIENSDAPIMDDLLLSVSIASNSDFTNLYDFTILGLSDFPNWSTYDFTSLDNLTFSFTLSNGENDTNFDELYMYYLQTDFVLDRYNFMVFRYDIDYDDFIAGDTYTYYCYKESTWRAYISNFDYYVYYDVSMPTFAWVPNNLFSSNSYFDGYLAGQNSVDTDIYFQQGVDSVNVDAIYANAYNAGYNAGLLETSHDYGISNLLFSIFDIPIRVMSNLFSFTIFGTEVWGLLISLMFVSFILFVTLKLLGKTSE